MAYVFTLLKEHDQFEYLLRKGMDRLPMLRIALLDFLRPDCVENRELFRLVALHFHMHAEGIWYFMFCASYRPQDDILLPLHLPVAAMWCEEADTILKPIVEQASKSILRANKAPGGSPSFKTAEASPIRKSSSALLMLDLSNVVVPMLKASPESKKNLCSAMQNLAHAAEYYLQVEFVLITLQTTLRNHLESLLQAGKLNHANSCAQKAELIALQIHMVNRSPASGQVYCILDLNAAQVNYLIAEYFT